MEGFSFLFLGTDDGLEKATEHFDKCLAKNPNNVEACLGKVLCHLKATGVSTASKRVSSNICWNAVKNADQLFQRIFEFCHGKANAADVFFAAGLSLKLDTADQQKIVAIMSAHLYVGLYLDCLFRKPGIGLSRASRWQYSLASEAAVALEQSSLDSGYQLSKNLCVQCESNFQNIYSLKDGDAPRSTFYQPYQLDNVSNPDPGFSTAIVGCWQLSSGHHGNDSPTTQELQSRCNHSISVGHTTFDMGDIYTGVEIFVGEFLETQTVDLRKRVQIHTKLVPDLDLLNEWEEQHTQAIVQRSMNRLGVEALDLVQFHWWDWGCGDHVKAYAGLCKCKCVRRVGVTNYDAQHLSELLEAGLPVACNQIQLSLLDRRAVADSLLHLCASSNLRVLVYGSLAGGFLSDRWLGKLDPVKQEREQNSNDSKIPGTAVLSNCLTNRSLVKYYIIIREFGGWALFQALLKVLRCIADRHEEESIATVAQAWVLAQPAVGGIILGLSGDRSHAECTKRAYWLAHELTGRDLQQIESVLQQSKGPKGEFYALERERDGPHGSIMRYNCGQLHTDSHIKEFCLRVDHFMGSKLDNKEQSGSAFSFQQGALLGGLVKEAQQFPDICRDRLLAGSTHMAAIFKIDQ